MVEEEVAGDFFFGGGGEEGVGAWEVNDAEGLVIEPEGAFGAGDGFAGPVAGVLAEAGEAVKEG